MTGNWGLIFRIGSNRIFTKIVSLPNPFQEQFDSQDELLGDFPSSYSLFII